MTRGTLFWVIFILMVVFGFVAYWPHGGGPYWSLGYPAVNLVLMGLLGWQVFGPAVKG